MSETATLARSAQNTKHFDVLIVGAGISGIGAAYHLTQQCPGKSFVVLETQESYGGTWLTHRYPGIRSDSDLHTFGYRFKPWTSAPIATADEIMSYMGAVSAGSQDNLWTIEATRLDTGEALRFAANFLWMCQGYYRHSEGYTPEWDGMEDFSGTIIHPQRWPEGLATEGKRIV